ncbi:MAG: hypothetical protein QXQ02_04155 [Halobacteria archaeon]
MRGVEIQRGISIYSGPYGPVLEVHFTADPMAENEALEAKSQMPESFWAREYDLNWNVAGGSLIFRDKLEMYAEQIIVDPFEIPHDWQVWMGLDWGWSAESAIVAMAMSPDDVIYATWEFYEANAVISRLADVILTHPFYQYSKFGGVYADPSIFRVALPMSQGKQPRGIGDALIDYGVRVYRARTMRKEGLQRLLDMWSNIEQRGAGFKIFSTCENLILELRNLRYDEKDPNDADSSMPDHCYDAIRYALSFTKGGTQYQQQKKITLMTDEPNSVMYWHTVYKMREEKAKVKPFRSLKDILAYNRERRKF